MKLNHASHIVTPFYDISYDKDMQDRSSLWPIKLSIFFWKVNYEIKYVSKFCRVLSHAFTFIYTFIRLHSKICEFSILLSQFFHIPLPHQDYFLPPPTTLCKLNLCNFKKFFGNSCLLAVVWPTVPSRLCHVRNWNFQANVVVNVNAKISF